MIYTNEQIGNPIEFLSENTELIEDIGSQGYEIVSGTDFDVLIRPANNSYEGYASESPIASHVLGNLYLNGIARQQTLGSVAVNLDWLPSPNACNQLSMKLDREPGVDVMKFVHSRPGLIPPGEYDKHLRSFEYPQSTSEDFFLHDRLEDHAVAVLLAPSQLINCIKYWKESNGNLSDRFEKGTMSLSRIYRSIQQDGIHNAYYGLDSAGLLLKDATHERGSLGTAKRFLRIANLLDKPDEVELITDMIKDTYNEIQLKVQGLIEADGSDGSKDKDSKTT